MSEQSGGSGEGLPWASVFDPAANARALEQIQRRGLEAAGELVDRLVALVDGARSYDPSTNGNGNGDGEAAPATGPESSNGSDFVGVWADLVTQSLQTMARLSVPEAGAPEPPNGGGVWVDAVSGRGHGVVTLVVVPGAGEQAERAELWLHNPTQARIGPLCVQVGELRSPQGTTVPAGTVSVQPAAIDELPPRSSRAVSVTVDGAGRLVPGRYRGMLQAEGADELAVPVELTVTEPA